MATEQKSNGNEKPEVTTDSPWGGWSRGWAGLEKGGERVEEKEKKKQQLGRDQDGTGDCEKRT